jgi:hypothetical protein
MKDFLQESDRDENRSIANEAIQKKSNEESHFEDNSPEAIQMRQLQGNIDNSDESIQMNKLQTDIGNNDETKQLMAFDHAAQEHDTAQLQGKEEELPKQKNTELPTELQSTGDNNPEGEQETVPNKPNNTGLPDALKLSIENLSGYSLDEVKVHYNSAKPAEVQAHAYAQGTDIYLGPGQEKHLPHEAWHVVQQMQGRVKPTVQMKGNVNVNDDKGLEKEADVMGDKALQLKPKENKSSAVTNSGAMKTMQLASFSFGNSWLKTEDMTYKELNDILTEMKNEEDIASLKDACFRELNNTKKDNTKKNKKNKKNKNKKSKVSKEELQKLLNNISGVPEKESEKIITTKDTSKMLAAHKYGALSEKIGILKNDKIDHWIHQDTALPESNVKGEIAEELTEQQLIIANPKKTVLGSVKVVIDNGVGEDYRYTEKADLDHLVVVSSDDGWIPEEIIETKAGTEGSKTGSLVTKLSKKLKELKKVVDGDYKILHKERDITNKFNLEALRHKEINLLTSGIYKNNNINLKESDIEGVFKYLRIVQQHYIAYKREW